MNTPKALIKLIKQQDKQAANDCRKNWEARTNKGDAK